MKENIGRRPAFATLALVASVGIGSGVVLTVAQPVQAQATHFSVAPRGHFWVSQGIRYH